jgi:hypothetical protein
MLIGFISGIVHNLVAPKKYFFSPQNMTLEQLNLLAENVYKILFGGFMKSQ